MFICMALFPSFSYLVREELWLVMEYMDGGTLYDAINEYYMTEDEIAVVSREVSQGSQLCFRGLGQDCLGKGLRTGAIPCARLCFCVAGMLWASKSISKELPASAPALTALCSCPLLSCAAFSLWLFYLLFSILPL